MEHLNFILVLVKPKVEVEREDEHDNGKELQGKRLSRDSSTQSPLHKTTPLDGTDKRKNVTRMSRSSLDLIKAKEAGQIKPPSIPICLSVISWDY